MPLPLQFKILAQYFNRNYHLFELNRSNPLGMKGHIAKRFGDLVREMWTSETRTIAPIKLRWTIGRYRAQFAGFQQQDAQASGQSKTKFATTETIQRSPKKLPK